MTIMELGKSFKQIFGFNPPIDLLMTMYKGPTNAKIDIIKLDDEFSKRDSDYDGRKCTYKDKSVSLAEYIEIKYGEEANKFIRKNM